MLLFWCEKDFGKINSQYFFQHLVITLIVTDHPNSYTDQNSHAFFWPQENVTIMSGDSNTLHQDNELWDHLQSGNGYFVIPENL